MDYQFHPIAAIFPLLEGNELQALADDIKANGLHEECWLYEGKVLDGRNRATACKLAGVEPTFREFSGDYLAAVAFVWSENATRRHLNSGQFALATAKRLDLVDSYQKHAEELAKEAARRKTEGQSKGGKTGGGGHPKKPALDNELSKAGSRAPRTSDKLAKEGGTNRIYLAAAQALLQRAKSDPVAAEKVKAVEKGDKKMTDVIREQKRDAIVANLEDVKAKEAKAVEGVFDVVVIDPPWPMQKIERDERPNQSEFDYPTMTEKELAALPIPTAKDCHVWLWTTHKFLPMALRLLEAWGLKYVCCFVWHKPGGFQPIGLPQYNCEFALYARKGSPAFIDTKALPTCFNAPRGKHSEKPDEFYDVVRRVTAGRRLDMFNRREIPGFDSWGNEAHGQ